MLSPNFTGENHSRFGSKDMTEDFFNQQRGAANTHYISMKEGNNGIVTGLNSKKKKSVIYLSNMIKRLKCCYKRASKLAKKSKELL